MPTIYRGSITQEQKDLFELSLSYLDKSINMRPVKDKLMTEFLILQVHDGDTFYDNNSGTLYWNPTRAHKVITEDGSVGVTSPAMALAHEMKHWATPETGEADEIIAKEFEGRVARDLGEPVRVTGTGVDVLGTVRVDNPTAHTSSGKWVAVDNSNNEFTGPAFDPENDTLVIGTRDEPSTGPGSGGDGYGGGGGVGGGGGGGTVVGGGGGGTGTVIVVPVKPPPDKHPEVIFNPTTDIPEIELVGIPEVYF